ncbi:hypothetical protein [Flavobacterium sp. N502540]|uniref:hypothetical protein n=1 Tax=Flavobacterium sp. N502540 TaxID=2986838 RepID=UPI002224A692|nr:hypothetical protein [Flavobacterium sp. N502540]
MLRQVALDDDKAIPNDKDWIYEHPRNALIFSKTSLVWNQLKKVYSSSFREMVTGHFPEENDILESLLFLSERIQRMEWGIKK